MAERTFVRAGTLIDGLADAPRRDALIVAEGERIVEVADYRAGAVNEDVPIIWLTNQVRLVATVAELEGVRLMPNTGILVLEDASFTD